MHACRKDTVQIDLSWIYRKIGSGAIQIKKDPIYACYLFPRTKQCVNQLERLKNGRIPHVSIPKVHHDG